MARPVPSTRVLRALRAQLDLASYTCPSCIHTPPRFTPVARRQQQQRTSKRHRSTLSAQQTRPGGTQSILTSPTCHQRRNVTYVAPVTSVNAARNVPEKNKKLHSALGALESVAAEYVNLSMLALALRGLESRDPITRIAVRSSAPRADARRLLRLLLIEDGNVPEQEWEAVLTRDDGDARALLIRFAETTDVDDSNPLVRILSVPSKTLEKDRLELLLIARSNSDPFAGLSPESEEDVLVQTIETPISSSGRHSQVTHPVHKTLLHGSGITGLLGTGYAQVEDDTRQSILLRHSTVDLGRESPEQPPENYGLSIISIARAERALKLRRASSGSQDSAAEDDWTGSKIAELRKFVLAGILPSTTVKPLHRTYISSILDATSSKIAQDQTAMELMQPDVQESKTSLAPLNKAVGRWAEAAHTELRDELTNAFAGRSWRKLAWWKLPFRVDDVGVIGSGILSRFYLADAEKGIVWVAGRLEQAGLTDADAQSSKLLDARPIAGDANVPETVSKEQDSPSRDVPDTYFHTSTPWPQQIERSRGRLLSETLPALQARAQALLLEAVSGTTLSTAVGALAYAMTSTTGLYEAGAVAAFGTAISLRRLQRRWDGSKETFVRDVENEGRATLEEVEKECKSLIAVAGQREPELLQGQEQRDEARKAVDEAWEALEELK